MVGLYKDAATAFNRTTVECKWDLLDVWKCTRHPFNRTTVECKFCFKAPTDPW